LRGSRPPTLRGGGALPHPVALLFALRTWSWWAVYLRTGTDPVLLKATLKTWAGRCSGFSLALGVGSQRVLLESLGQHLEFGLISLLFISPLLFFLVIINLKSHI
jgi:hypothetical protein